MNTWKYWKSICEPSDFHISVSPPRAASCRGRWPSLLLGRATGKMNQFGIRTPPYREREILTNYIYMLIMCVCICDYAQRIECVYRERDINALNIYIYNYIILYIYTHTLHLCMLWTLLEPRNVYVSLFSWSRGSQVHLAPIVCGVPVNFLLGSCKDFCPQINIIHHGTAPKVPQSPTNPGYWTRNAGGSNQLNQLPAPEKQLISLQAVSFVSSWGKERPPSPKKK